MVQFKLIFLINIILLCSSLGINANPLPSNFYVLISYCYCFKIWFYVVIFFRNPVWSWPEWHWSAEWPGPTWLPKCRRFRWCDWLRTWYNILSLLLTWWLRLVLRYIFMYWSIGYILIELIWQTKTDNCSMETHPCSISYKLLHNTVLHKYY